MSACLPRQDSASITMETKAISIFRLFLIIALTTAFTSCVGTGSRSSDSTDADTSSVYSGQQDYDIAMTVRSIMDALTVSQPLDSTEYSYRGILTDGSGRPLYTDIQGAPGVWRVQILSPTSALIKNEYLGDLLPEDLISYLVANIGLSSSQYVTSGQAATDPDAHILVYDTADNEILFETLEGITPSGDTGPMINILIRKKSRGLQGDTLP